MKELVHRSILGDNPRKKEISIEEISKRTGNHISKKWICKYFVKEKFASGNVHDLKEWIKGKKANGVKKDCHILRKFNAGTGENKIICKVLGDFFVILARTAYRIVYVNEIRIKIDRKVC